MKPSEIFSIFGQCETVVAEAMVSEGKLRMIVAEAIPSSARFNEEGRSAAFAVVVPAKYRREFEERCSDLRA